MIQSTLFPLVRRSIADCTPVPWGSKGKIADRALRVYGCPVMRMIAQLCDAQNWGTVRIDAHI